MRPASGALCLLLLAGWLGRAPDAGAASVQMRDETRVSADVLQVDDESVVLRVPRGDVHSVDGVAMPPPLAEGMAAPAFAVVDLQGVAQAVGPSAAAPTALHFWVSWCPFCRADQPALQQLYERFGREGRVRFITVSLDEQREAIEKFLAQHQAGYPVISAREQAAVPGGANLPELYQISSFPVTLLIDAQGVIRRKISGSFVKGDVDLAAAIEQLLPSAR